MAFRLGITGLPNTGKSFSWKDYRGDDLFAIIPSAKILHARTSDGKLLSSQPLKLKSSRGEYLTLEEIQQKTGKSPYEIISSFLNSGKSVEEIGAKGHYVQCSDVNHVATYKLFISKYLPNIKLILNPDFTHYISYIIQSKAFQRRKSGGEAFARLICI